MRRNAQNHGMGFNNSPGRPLLNEHLKDIDLELELLKRKREMLEQQQQLYEQPQYNSSPFNQPRQYGSVPPHYDSNKFGSNRDFSNMYDDSPNQQSRKRQSEPVWQHDTPSKRYAGRNKKKSVASVFGNRLGPKPSSFSPRNTGPSPGNNPNPFAMPSHSPKPSIAQRIGSQKNPQRTPQKNFTPKKVAKPKPTPPPNAIAAKPVAERVVLVSEAIKSSVNVEDLILREDRVPTQQMTGRLELALGSIMKEINHVYGETAPYDAIFRSASLQRVMKQAIRERIKCVMLGKVVGPFPEILQTYRAEYPKETDIDIVNIAMEAAGITREENVSTKTVEAVKPDEFLKVNMYNLLSDRLKEMFDKLQEMYVKGENDQAEDSSKKPEEINFADDNIEEQGNLEGDSKAVEITFSNNRDPGIHLIKRLLPSLLRKYTPSVINILNADRVFQSAKDEILSKTKTRQAELSRKKEAGQDAIETGAQSEEARPVLPYFIKILARPSLPKRKVMREFLDQFNCRSIKKHRNVHNMLFIGFADKTDYDNILAATGTVVGRATIQILPSEKAAQKDIQDESKQLTTTELVEQTNDMTTIGKAEEHQEVGTQETKTEDAEKEEQAQGNEDQGEQVEENQNVEETDKLNDSEIQLIENDDENEVVEIKDDTENEEIADENRDDVDDQNEKDATDTVEETTENVEESEKPAEEEEIKDVVAEEEEGKKDVVAEGEAEKKDEVAEEEEEKKDVVGKLKSGVNETGRATPTRVTRSGNVTPSTIKTRRASRLAQN